MTEEHKAKLAEGRERARQAAKEQKKSDPQPKTPEQQGKPEEAMIPLSQIEKVIEEKLKQAGVRTSGNEQLVDALKQVIAEKEIGGTRELIDESDIPLDDVLAEPVIFWTTGLRHAIFSEKRKGHDVAPPWKRPIIFTVASSGVKGTGRDAKQWHICSFSTYSKRVAEWIRSSTRYGVTIFENVKNIAEMDTYMAAKLAEAGNVIGKLDAQQIFSQAQQLGLPLSQNIEQVKLSLIQYHAEKEMKRMKEVQRQTAATSTWTPDEKVAHGKAAKASEDVLA